jgi:hypothetical protein
MEVCRLFDRLVFVHLYLRAVPEGMGKDGRDMAEQRPLNLRRAWLREHRRAIIIVIVVVAVLVLLPLLVFPFLGGLGGGVISEMQ